MMKKIVIIFIVLLSNMGFAQREAAVWYFGTHAGLDFNNTAAPPVLLTDGQMDTYEGCASISDATGNLLFYVGAPDTNPNSNLRIWNKNHTVMPNGTGLLGSVSATQAAMIVPKPDDANIYYVFTVGKFTPSNTTIEAIKYSVVDMSLDGGMGDVISTQKNVAVAGHFSEKITAVKGDGNYYWIIAYGSTVGSFDSIYAYKLDATGVLSAPVISTAGTVTNDGRGYLKIDATGSKLALANTGGPVLRLYDFDIATGQVTGGQNLSIPAGMFPYGLEFSLSGDKLYTSLYSGGSSSGAVRIRQYDLLNANASVDVASNTPNNATDWGYRSALQMAIDGKIYVTLPNAYTMGTRNMAVINNPESVGAACGFVLNAITFPNTAPVILVHQGLPPFIQSFFNVSIVYNDGADVCEGSTVNFSINSNQALTATDWDFGDGSPVVSGTENPTHVFPVINDGTDHTYTVNLHTEYIGDLGQTESQDFTQDITIYAQPELPAGATLATIQQCDDDNDGFYDFDLHALKDAEALGLLTNASVANFQVRYFPSEADLDADANEIVANPYTNVIANNETLWVRIENVNHTDCYEKVSFAIEIYELPILPAGALVNPIEQCDDDNDGFYDFDLHTLKDAEALGLLTNASTADFQVRYFSTEADLDADTNEIVANPYANVIANNETLWIRIENINHIDCYTKITFDINIYEQPMLPAGATLDSIQQCDDDNDGFYDFDLHTLKDTEALGLLTNASTANFQVRYFPTEADLDADTNEIVINPYTNVIANNETLWVRIENVNHADCYEKISFAIEVYDTPTAGVPDNLTDCDNALDGDDANGFISWDLVTANDALLLNGQNTATFELFYYASNADLLANTPIADPTNYTNVATPQTIFVKIRNRNNTTCEVTTSFTLTVNPLPTLQAGVVLHQCDEDALPNDGLTNFNLNEANAELLTPTANYTFTYFEDAALTTQITPQDNYINTSNPQTVYALVQNNTTLCIRSIAVTLETSASQLDPNLMVNLENCDDDGAEDGFHLFDLQDASTTILATLPAGQTYDMSYYATLADAQLEQNALPLTNYMSTAQSQDIFVRVDNATNNDCFGIGVHVNLLTNPLPQPILGDYFFCTNIGFVTLDATINDGNTYSYVWDTGETTASINAIAAGDHTVTVTNTVTNCSNSAVAHVAESSAPDTIYIVAVDNSQNNSMEILVTGIGDYEYSIDNGVSFYDSNYFDHLAPGFYDVVVRDKNGCGTITTMKALVGFPPFFTPNADGFNDYWKPKGVLMPELVTIKIFDRYGKLLKTIRADSEGWDGLYNGIEMPSTDYWFHVILPNPDGREFRSHFALKR